MRGTSSATAPVAVGAIAGEGSENVLVAQEASRSNAIGSDVLFMWFSDAEGEASVRATVRNRCPEALNHTHGPWQPHCAHARAQEFQSSFTGAGAPLLAIASMCWWTCMALAMHWSLLWYSYLPKRPNVM